MESRKSFLKMGNITISLCPYVNDTVEKKKQGIKEKVNTARGKFYWKE
jgi:hypothetical protein